jgi:hypothetical protein
MQGDPAQGSRARGLRQHPAQAEARINNFRFSISAKGLISLRLSRFSIESFD